MNDGRRRKWPGRAARIPLLALETSSKNDIPIKTLDKHPFTGNECALVEEHVRHVALVRAPDRHRPTADEEPAEEQACRCGVGPAHDRKRIVTNLDEAVEHRVVAY